MKRRKIVSACAIFAIALIALKIMGYDFSSPGWKVGEKAFAEKNVKLCSKIFNTSIFGPPTAMRRAQCIRTYAELTKDPSACELLMPSSYGLSCVGGAEDHHLPCGSDKYVVYWQDGEKAQSAGLQDCVKSNANRSALGNQCCQVAKVKYLTHENDCSSLTENTPVHDRCLYELAWKAKDSKYCEEITNENAKSACAVQAKALQKDPSICSGCTKPLENIDQLK